MRNTDQEIARLYSSIKSRERRAKYEPWAEIARAARDAADGAIRTRKAPAFKKFKQLESQWLRRHPGNLASLAEDLQTAVLSAPDNEIGRRVNTYAAGADPEEGWIYLLMSNERPGQFKIGYTADLRQRLVKMRYRYQLPDAIYLYARYARKPALLEERVQDFFKSSRIYDNTRGGSIEWFRGEMQDFFRKICELGGEGTEFFCEGTRYYLADEEGRLLATPADYG